jgi:hypothetical protein
VYVITVHNISQSEPFFAAAQSTPIPQGMALRSMIPSSDHSRCVCVWEAGACTPTASARWRILRFSR